MSEKTKEDFPLFSFIAIMTIGYVHVFCPLEKMAPPEYDIHTRGRLFNPTNGKHLLNRAESHRCQVTHYRNLLVILARLEGYFF